MKQNCILILLFFVCCMSGNAQLQMPDAIRRFLELDNAIQVLPVYTVSNKRVGVSNNFYVKLLKEE